MAGQEILVEMAGSEIPEVAGSEIVEAVAVAVAVAVAMEAVAMEVVEMVEVVGGKVPRRDYSLQLEIETRQEEHIS